MRRWTFDIESDGLLDVLSVIHCVSLQEVDEDGNPIGDSKHANDHGAKLTVADAVNILHGQHVIGHNILGFDIPAIQKLFPDFAPGGYTDTLLLSTLLYPDIKDIDFNVRKKETRAGKEPSLPGKLIGRHGLEAWGYRLRQWKGDYAQQCKEQGIDPWANWSQAMSDYCDQDVVVTVELLKRQLRKGLPPRALELEQAVAPIVARMTKHGWLLDKHAATELEKTLVAKRAELAAELAKVIPPWQRVKKRFVPKRDDKRRGYVKGVEAVVYETIVFNPASRDHIANRLSELYGWVPEEFTESGKPKIDETVLEGLKYPIIPLLLEFFIVNKRLGQLSEGDKAWFKVVKKDGRIHGSVNQNGAVTGRMTHNDPNMAQVPKVGVPYGAECRALFIVPKGKKLVGADASGLELRCLAHFMARWDNGEYAKVILEGDIHSVNQKAAGLPTRDNAKTFIYGFLYGAGDEKVGKIVGRGRKAGGELRKRFLAGLPALKSLVDGVKKKARAEGFLLGLDGRKLHVRSDHAALNTLLQSAGALIMKQAIVNLDRELQRLGYKPGVDYEFVGMIHDEVQIECNEDIADTVGKTCVWAMNQAGRDFNFRCPIDGEYKVGNNWAETH